MNASVNEPAPQVEASPAEECQEPRPHNKATVAPHKPRIAPAKAKSTEQAESATKRQMHSTVASSASACSCDLGIHRTIFSTRSWARAMKWGNGMTFFA